MNIILFSAIPDNEQVRLVMEDLGFGFFILGALRQSQESSG